MMDEKYTHVPLGTPEVGMKFDSFDEVEIFMKNYEEDNLVKYTKRNNTRTIISARSRWPKRQFEDRLKYYTALFTCIHNGEDDDDTPVVRRFVRTGCMSKIRFMVTPDGTQLIVTEVNLEHNHKFFPKCPSMRFSKLHVQSLCLKTRRNENGESLEPLCPPEIGMLFDTYEDVDKFMRDYQEANFVKYFKKDTRTMNQAHKRFPKRKLNDALKYYSVMFACIHSGEPKENSDSVHKIIRMGCMSRIRFMATPTGNQLALTELVEDHNHCLQNGQPGASIGQKRPISESVPVGEPNQIKGRKTAMDMLRKSGRLTMANLRNLSAAAISQHHSQSYQHVQSILDQLSHMEDSTSTVEIVTKDDGRIVGIFFQEQEMKRVFHEYPQYMIIDTSCKYNTLRIPLYVLLIEDGNGNVKIVAYLMLIASNPENIRSMLMRFKMHNPNWSETKIITADREFVDRQVLREEFPEVSLQIPMYNVLRSFEMEVANRDITLEQEVILHSLRILKSLAKAKSEAAYTAKYQLLLNTELDSLIEYYNSTWHKNRCEWVEGLKPRSTVVKGVLLTDQLELIREPLRSVFENPSEEIMANLKKVVDLLREEKHKSAAMMESPLLTGSTCPITMQFQAYLTPLAMKHMSKQLKHSWKVRVKGSITDQSCYVKMSQGEASVSVDSCHCRFWQSLSLPCRHILAVRRYKGLPVFETNIINRRWSLENYKDSCRLTALNQTQAQSNDYLSHSEKLFEISQITEQLAAVASEAPMALFAYHMAAVKNLLSVFRSGSSAEVVVKAFDKEAGDAETEGKEALCEQAQRSAAMHTAAMGTTAVDIATVDSAAMGTGVHVIDVKEFLREDDEKGSDVNTAMIEVDEFSIEHDQEGTDNSIIVVQESFPEHEEEDAPMNEDEIAVESTVTVGSILTSQLDGNM